MNKKIGLFGRLFRFIDRKIVVPITRFLMKSVKWFSNSNKTLENWLSRSNTLLFISLFLAILIFIVIDQKMTLFTNTSAEVLKDRKVNAVYNEVQGRLREADGGALRFRHALRGSARRLGDNGLYQRLCTQQDFFALRAGSAGRGGSQNALHKDGEAPRGKQKVSQIPQGRG